MSKLFNIHDWQAKRRQQLLKEGFPMSQRPTYGQDFEPEDTDNPDEDLVIIGSGALDIENKFRERHSQTNGEYAAKGQEFVKKFFKGDKEAALDFIYSQINENDDAWQKRQDRLTPGKNPDEFYGDDSIMGKLKKDPAYIKKLNAKNAKVKEHHNDEDFPGKNLSAWDLLDKIKSGDKELYDRVEDFMKSMNENTLGTGASFNAGAGEGYMTPNAFKKKNKED